MGRTEIKKMCVDLYQTFYNGKGKKTPGNLKEKEKEEVDKEEEVQQLQDNSNSR